MAATSRMEFIARTQLTGAAASVSFATGLSGFTKFFVVAYFVSDANNKGVFFTINNDSGANYAAQKLGASGATVSSARATGGTYVELDYPGDIQASTAALFILEISKPVAGEVARATVRQAYTGATPGIDFGASAIEWTNTAALISRLDFAASSNNFTTGTRILLYGSKD